MRPDIVPIEPLSQVVFIHDYLQLVFQEVSYSIFNAATLRQREVEISQGQSGFCDTLVGLIGQRLVSVSCGPPLALTFQGGAVLNVAQSGLGPEAWLFTMSGGQVLVEQNA